MTRFGSSQPIHTTIMEMLRRKTTWTDVELYKDLKRSHGDLSHREFNRTLMKLEVVGLIHVAYLTKTKRSVELT